VYLHSFAVFYLATTAFLHPAAVSSPVYCCSGLSAAWHLISKCLHQQLLGRLRVLLLCTVQAPGPCYDVCAVPTSMGQQAVCDTSPARGRPLLTFLLCPCRVACSQVTSCVKCECAACLLACLRGLERFSYGRGRSGPIIMFCCILDYTSCSPCTE